MSKVNIEGQVIEELDCLCPGSWSEYFVHVQWQNLIAFYVSLEPYFEGLAAYLNTNS